jgi:hypothetical protein
MSAFFLATLMLSVAAFIHTRSAHPSMRPENAAADQGWRVLSFAALVTWGALVVWGFTARVWSEALAALLGSFALNALFLYRGPRPAWPAVSMLFGVTGLALAAWSFAYE